MSVDLAPPTVRRRVVALGAAALVLTGLAAPAVAPPPASAATVTVPDLPVGADGLARAIVAYDGGVVPAGALDTLDELGVVRGIELSTIGAVAVTAPQAVIETVAALDDRIVAVEPQRRLQTDLYASKDQISAVGLDTAATYRPDGATTDATRPGVTGEGVVVAVLDSGIFAEHPDFLRDDADPSSSRVTTGLHFAFSEIQDSGGISYEQWDSYAESTGPIALQDEIGHGTHVASTVGGDGSLAASTDGPDLAGVAPGVELISMKVADAPFGIVDDIDWEEAALAAFDYSIRHKDELGITMTQNSWGLLPAEPDCLGAGCGEPTDFDAMAEMIGAVEDAGISVIFSAGNSGPDPDTIGHYHRADQALLVGAACKQVDGACPDGEMTDFSSRGAADGSGPQVDVAAPGDRIMAALSPSVLTPLTECPETQHPGYFCISGTSMASPHVSGVAALMYEANPDLTVPQAYDCIIDTADDMLAAGVDRASGHGMVNARAAVECAHALTLARAPGDGAGVVTRLWGADRLRTATAVSKASHPQADSADAVLLARMDDFADGLAGTPLAAAMDAPLLLTPSDRLDDVTLAEVRRVLPDGGRVLLLGGRAALAPAVADALRDAGFRVERADGATRFDTAVAIAERLGELVDLRTAIIARGDDFPDALAAGPAATATDGAILLSDGDRRSSATDAFLASHPDLDRVAVGGPAAAAHPEAQAVSGPDRAATAAEVAATFLPSPSAVGIARQDGFADALTGGVHAASRGMPILLTAGDSLPAPTGRFVSRTDSLAGAVVYGGQAAVSRAVVEELDQRLR